MNQIINDVHLAIDEFREGVVETLQSLRMPSPKVMAMGGALLLAGCGAPNRSDNSSYGIGGIDGIEAKIAMGRESRMAEVIRLSGHQPSYDSNLRQYVYSGDGLTCIADLSTGRPITRAFESIQLISGDALDDLLLLPSRSPRYTCSNEFEPTVQFDMEQFATPPQESWHPIAY